MQGGHGRLSGRGDRRRRQGLTKRRRLFRNAGRETVRARVLREWRGVGEPLDLNQNVSKAADLLQSVLSQLNLNEGIEESRLRGAWKDVAGEFIAKQTEPVSLQDGILTLRVLQPSMRFHLEQSRGELRARLQAKLGRSAVREVRLTIG